jgi:hypothetical protein
MQKSTLCSLNAFTPKRTCTYSAANRTTTRLQKGDITAHLASRVDIHASVDLQEDRVSLEPLLI